jgi:hypothetical protein
MIGFETTIGTHELGIKRCYSCFTASAIPLPSPHACRHIISTLTRKDYLLQPFDVIILSSSDGIKMLRMRMG